MLSAFIRNNPVSFAVRTFIGIILLFPVTVSAANYEIRKISDTVYMAEAVPGGKAVSNAMFVVAGHEVILAGAHFVQEGINELVKEIGVITPLPVNHVILTHHHRGFNYVDFDLPPKAEVVVSLQIWQELTAESREFKNPNLVFENTLTLNRGAVSLVLMSMGKGHSNGDVVIYMPREGVLFASDLLFNDTVGFMGEASVHDWGESLEYLEDIPARVVIPGVGKISDAAAIIRFKKYYRAFMSEVLRNIEKGNTLAQTKKEFSLEAYKDLPGFNTFMEINLERAYKQLKSR